mmetsp:Transcript_54331/g.132766  ORF Transcript_54331/g.132766 Transcript_54331/m.132766 type:complete len:202 (-) Transcript_54331:1836-2441(-)
MDSPQGRQESAWPRVGVVGDVRPVRVALGDALESDTVFELLPDVNHAPVLGVVVHPLADGLRPCLVRAVPVCNTIVLVGVPVLATHPPLLRRLFLTLCPPVGHVLAPVLRNPLGDEGHVAHVCLPCTERAHVAIGTAKSLLRLAVESLEANLDSLDARVPCLVGLHRSQVLHRDPAVIPEGVGGWRVNVKDWRPRLKGPKL